MNVFHFIFDGVTRASHQYALEFTTLNSSSQNFLEASFDHGVAFPLFVILSLVPYIVFFASFALI